ncbi:molybdopterin molybdotransferase MoeA [Altererythrobacter arenosus]|uniref:Molybdopterin molybdenumtransferase n=1 Tax=Altererythrobacter arenosus TaxID=3032592 RepID=A0ABY8FVR3_9SPHN|nr:gephyrin-like molybdotransferase Glp [Altererythrobacter sp. CAU 1644]WFL79091.1 molybdopterin molybdotransferase MoeA [Altererythrobacter sp. CAU 1644]
MLSVAEAQARALALAPKMPVVELDAAAAAGRYLASDLHARRTQPPADLSAMDGYAIVGDGPWTVIGESRAGAPFGSALIDGQAVRISTGAHMPAGADRVLIQENAERTGDHLRCTEDMPGRGKHVRTCGFDFSEGDLVLGAGSRIGAAQVALAITAGHSTLPVHEAPLVAVIDSGDELSVTPEDCAPHQIPASNGAMLTTLLARMGCRVERIGPVPDDRQALVDAFASAERADFVITSGGASVGDHDLIRPALEEWGASLDFWKVAMKPGKPLLIAQRENQLIFGLPGNPVSSFVTAFLFVLPSVRAAMGAAETLPRLVTLKAGCSLPAGGSRQEFIRGSWDGLSVTPADSQDSSALAALAASNCLIARGIDASPISAGEAVECYLLENG